MTRPTASRSPTTARAGPSRWSRASSTTYPASVRCAARPCSSTSARWGSSASCRSRRDRGGAGHRAADGGGHRGCAGRGQHRARQVNTATVEIREHSHGRDRRVTPAEDATAEPGEVVVVTGMTGAGRSTAAKELEDLGYYVVDNLPPRLSPTSSGWSTRAAGDAADRGRRRRPVRRRSSTACRRCSPRAPPAGTRRCVFLEANDDVLVRRQEAARRPHPLQERRPAARRAPARADRAGRAARRRRPGHRHQHSQRAPAHRQDRRRVRHRRRPSPEGDASSASASSTASRSTPTWSPTCASSRTRTGCPSCAR